MNKKLFDWQMEFLDRHGQLRRAYALRLQFEYEQIVFRSDSPHEEIHSSLDILIGRNSKIGDLGWFGLACVDTLLDKWRK